MIRSAQNTTKKLLIEDSGIAMPISLLVFLFLTFVCMSVFALGEVIRTRTELQYKVDNAAYAAALVQADSLSRIAVLNRALAWTYAQTNKRQMDYIVSRWLTESYDAFIEDADMVAGLHSANSVTACNEHKTSVPENKRLHTTDYDYGKTDVLYGVTNASLLVDLSSIIQSSLSGGFLPAQRIHGIFEEGTQKDAERLQEAVDVLRPLLTVLQDDIKVGSANIHTMNEQIKEIQDNLPSRIYLAVTEILGKNNNGLTVGVGEYWYKENQKKPTWFTIPDSWNEFKSRYIVNSDPDSWGEKGWWAPVKGKDGINHSYVGNFQLQWQPYYVGWSCQPDKHIPVPVINFPLRTVSTGMSPDGTPWGNICDGVLWNNSPKVNPAKLIPGFFGKNGSIVVAAKTPIPDLFGNVFGKNKFLNFQVDGNLWAVSAARAGYRNGEKYENSKFLNEEEWNLFVDDWDAMFLPVGRCWKSWDGEKFTGDDAYKVLEAVADNLDIDISENGLKLNEKVNLDVLH